MATRRSTRDQLCAVREALGAGVGRGLAMRVTIAVDVAMVRLQRHTGEQDQVNLIKGDRLVVSSILTRCLICCDETQ